MAEIVFDAFNPNDACLQIPKGKPNQADPCRVQGRFHVRDGATPEDPRLVFRREGDRFILETGGNETISGLVRGMGFSEADPKVQSAIFYSVSLHKWIRENHATVARRFPAHAESFLSFYEKFRNFIVLGSVLKPDEAQRRASASLLREVLLLPRLEKNWAMDSIKTLLKVKSRIVPEMLPRIRWLASLGEAHQNLQPELPRLPKTHLFRPDLDAWSRDLLVFLGSGAGDAARLKTGLDALMIRQLGTPDASKFPGDLYAFYAQRLSELRKDVFFLDDPAARSRIQDFLAHLKNSSDERRAELLYLGGDPRTAPDAFSRSLAVRLGKAAARGELLAELRSESVEPTPREWLAGRDPLARLGEAVLSGVALVPEPGSDRVGLDPDKIRAALKKLFKDNTLQKRNYLIGALAVLRHLFGKDADAPHLVAWVRNGYRAVPIAWTPETRKEMSGLLRSLRNQISFSLKGSERILPWVEGAVCVVGLGLGGAGLGTKTREMTVGGSTAAGLGCGALAAHFLFRKRNHYLVDSLGGALGAGLGFGLSFALTRARGATPHPPLPPPPPPPVDPARRNPTDTHGP